MGRLIDADALCRHLSDWQFGSMTDGKHEIEYAVINKVIDGIEQEPTVKPIKVGDVCKDCWRESGNAVEVVRCEDCKHWDDVHITERGHECNLINGNKYKIRIATPSDWFCPMGERRSE